MKNPFFYAFSADDAAARRIYPQAPVPTLRFSNRHIARVNWD